MKKGEEIMWNLQDNNKKNNKHTIGNTATEKGTESICEGIMNEKFPNIRREK